MLMAGWFFRFFFFWLPVFLFFSLKRLRILLILAILKFHNDACGFGSFKVWLSTFNLKIYLFFRSRIFGLYGLDHIFSFFLFCNFYSLDFGISGSTLRITELYTLTFSLFLSVCPALCEDVSAQVFQPSISQHNTYHNCLCIEIFISVSFLFSDL